MSAKRKARQSTPKPRPRRPRGLRIDPALRVLTPRETAFVTAFLSGSTAGNATASAIAAGSPKAGAAVTGHRLLKRAKVLAAITAHRKQAVASAAASTQAGLKPWAELVPEAQTALLECTRGGRKASRTRVAAADAILDRALGKPPVRVQHTGHTIEDVLDELDAEATRQALGGVA